MMTKPMMTFTPFTMQ